MPSCAETVLDFRGSRLAGAALLLTFALSGPASGCADQQQAQPAVIDDADAREDRAARSPSVTSSAPQLSASATAGALGSADDGVPTLTMAESPKRPGSSTTKTYRVTACLYGSLALKQQRRAYLESLAGQKPSPSRIPEFGAEPVAKGAAPALPRMIRTDQFIRHCNTAIAVKHAADAKLDPAVKEFAEYALALSKTLQEANQYYAAETFRDDSFKRGEEIHACLTGPATCLTTDGKQVKDAFSLLDERLKKLEAAVHEYVAAHPIDRSSYIPSQKKSDEAAEQATALVRAIDANPADASAFSVALSKLEAAAVDLKKMTPPSDAAPDPWVKWVTPELEQLIAAAKLVGDPAKAKPHQIFKIISVHNRMLEKSFSSLQIHIRRASSHR